MNGISRFSEFLQYDSKGLAIVMRGQSFYIFKQKGFRLFGFQNFLNVKKKRSPGICKTKAFASNTKRLAGKSSQ